MYKFRPSENKPRTRGKDEVEPEQQAGPEIAPREAVGVHRVLAGSTGNKDEEIESDDPEISRELMVGMASIEELRAFLSGCRVTPNHRFSVIDSIMKVTGCSYDAAKDTWHRIFQKLSRRNSTSASGIFETYKFSGQGQNNTPVATIPNLLRIFSRIPGKVGEYIRSKNDYLAARANAGDSDLRDAIHRRGENISASAQEVLMGDLPSTKQAQQDREERKQQENGAPRLECNIEELREIAQALSPAMKFTDVQLKLNWEISKSDRIEFVTQMMSFIKKFFETAEAAEKYQKAQHETSAAEQLAKEAEEKRKRAEEERKTAEEQREQQRQASDEQRQQQLKASEEQREQQLKASDEQREQQLKASDEQRELQRKAADEEREIRRKAAELQETNTNELFQSSKRRSVDQEAEASAKRRKAELEVTTAASQPEREKKTEKRKEKGTTKRHKLTETEITTREKNALDAKIELEKIALQKSMIEKARKDKTIREIAKIFANKTSECGEEEEEEEEVEEAAENKDEEEKKEEEPAPPPKKTVRVSGSGRPGFSQTMGDTTFTNEKEEEKEEQDDVVVSESEHSDSRNDIKEDEEEEEEDDDDHDSDSDFFPSDAEELELALETPRSVKHIQARLTSWIEYTKLHARFAVASNAHVVVKNSTVPRKELDQLTGVKLLDYNQSHIPYKKFGLEGPSAELNPFKPLEFFLAIKPTETGLKLSSFARNL